MSGPTLCPESECARPIRKAGMCDTHYAQKRRNGLLPTASPTLCVTCGTTITPANLKPRKFCSPQCLRDHHNQIKNAADAAGRLRARSDRTCSRCGATFTPKDSKGKFCSATCRHTAMSQMHRSRMHAADAETFDHVEIFDRDGWVCQLCGLEVDKRLPGANRLGPSLDHVIPLTLGGAHTRSNVQLAHRRCNAAKGNRWVG